MAYRPRNRVISYAGLTAGAVSLATLKDHLRVTHNDEDAGITAYGLAATGVVERWTQRLLVRRQIILRLPDLPSGQCPVELPGGEIGSITSFLSDGVSVTGTAAIGDSPAVLVPSADWPTVTGEGYPVVITYQAGYTAPPGELLQAVLMIAADLYDTRSNTNEGSTSKAVVSAEWLMAPHRIWAAA